ncbi:hypothetical protein L1987_05908 [Smallanthus sonchifolius]|uniref:Uncharacterized protein n=1 Tax=Smallanthus sonchifolius TaxID=185202 RepID=A0ACB9JWX5_9ASTR|nr:hypothetical protein L1987_05908 [Smallanthus sonchifolius]
MQAEMAEMVCTRSKVTLNKPHYKTLDSPPKPDIFKNLISILESPADIKSQLLKSTYYFLIQLSSKTQICNEFFIETNEGEVRVSLRDVHTLSSILFKNLQKRLKQLHSSKHDVSATRSLELEELNLLIRCCMVTLTLCVPQEHLLESGRRLLLIFKKLSLLEVAENADFKKSLSCQCMCSGEITSNYFAEVASLSSLELFDTCIPSITTILEVIIDELLVHGRLRKYLQIIDSFTPTNERLFKANYESGYFGLTMEMICSHFLLSISDEVALQEFLNRLTWAHSNNSKSLALGIIPAKTLLQNPIVLSSPKLLQAHIVSLVADVISIGIDHETLTLDPMLIDCYLSLFESSVKLYTQHMSILKTENHPSDARDNLVNLHNKSSYPSFESCIDPGKSETLSQIITTLNNSWNSSLRRELFVTKSDLLSFSIDYIEQNLCIIDITRRDEILSFLKCMIMRAANDVNDIKLPLDGDASLQDICLLASLLMLMSNSLIQALKGIPFCKGYDVIVGIISCFKEFNIRLPIQKFSYSLMERNPTSHKESRLMLLHFLGLLSLSFDSGLGFLVKSCISVIMGLSNLFVLEEGNVDALRSLADPRSLSSEGSPAIYKEAYVCQYPSLGVAAKFQKTRTLYVSNVCAVNESTEYDRMEKLGVTKETCSGEAYLKTRNVSNIDDLADFVECQKDKDYANWLKDREKFREWKLAKRVKRRWEKKKQAWKSMI